MGITTESVLNFISTLIVEPLLFIIMFGFSIRGVSFQGLLSDKACNILQKDANETLNCTQFLSKNENCTNCVGDEVQQIASMYEVGTIVLGAAPAVVISTFMAPWSNKYGRRLPVFLALIGLMIQNVLDIVNAAIPDLHIGFTLLSSFFSGFPGGGLVVVFTSVYSYVSDAASKEKDIKTIRFALIELSMLLGMPLGILAGGQILKYEGHVSVFGIAALSNIVAILWIIFVYKEKRSFDKTTGIKRKFQDLFCTQNLKTNFQVCLKKREGNIRAQVWLIILGMTANLFNMTSSMTIGYYFASKMYDWNETKYSNVETVFMFLNALVTITVIPFFLKVLKMGDIVLGLIGITTSFTKSFLRSIAYKSWLYFLASLIGSLSTLTSVASRTRLTKLVPKDEIGNVFSVLSMIEALAPTIGGALTGSIYSASVKFFPGLVYFIGSILMIIPATVFIWMWRWGTKASNTALTPELESTSDRKQENKTSNETSKDDVGLVSTLEFNS